jgi:SAM-dependent methyltransferase
MQAALTDQRYWDDVWRYTDDFASTPAPRIYDAMTDRFLQRAFRIHLGKSRRFLEVGAGGSPWPAWIASAIGAEAWGIDFSRAGLAMAARAVAADGARVSLVEGDLFDKERLPARYFDVVYSGGFVEHFPNPRPVMERFADLIAPGGVMVTLVPNLCGINGLVQRVVDKETFERHVTLSTHSLDAAHATGGLVPVEPARYLDLFDLGAVNLSRVANWMPSPAWRGVNYALALARRAGVWYSRRQDTDGGRWFAPMIGGIYRRADD